MKVKIFRTCRDNHLPNRANNTDAGYDVFASERVDFEAGETKLVPIGIIAQAPEGFHFKLLLRSSMAYKRGFLLANSVGIIDTGFCSKDDEMKMIITFMGKEGTETILKGDRIGQLLLERNNNIEWVEQDKSDFAENTRGGGIGSTGR